MALPGIDTTQALALDAQALSGLRRDARADPQQALSKAAGQFEAMFLQMVLKQMRETLPKDGPFDTDTMRTYTSMFDQQIAQHLSSRGLGLREALERQLGRTLPGAKAGPATPATPVASTPGQPVAAAAGTPQPARDALRRAGAQAAAPLPDHAVAKAAPRSVAQNVQDFVDRLKPHAEVAARVTGIPAHLLIAQAGLETGWGRSQPRNADGSASNNLFGVKAGGRWSGASVAAATTEFVQGAAVRTVERFRSYGSVADSFRDFAKVLGADRYAAARVAAQSNDEAGFARGLQKGGYATDPQYADKLTRAIRMVSQHLAGTPAVRVAASDAQESAAAADNRIERSAT